MENNIKKNSASLGLILGLIFVLETAIMYSFDLSLFTNTWIGVFNFVIVLAFGIYNSIKNKKDLGGNMSYKEAFMSFIIPIIVGIFIFVVFNIILFNLIDPSAKEIITENIIEMTKNMMGKFNVPAEKINEAISEIENKDNFGPLAQLQSYLFQVVFYSVLGLLIALIFKTPTNKQ